MNKKILSRAKEELMTSTDYSIRRYYVDEFYTRHSDLLRMKAVLDVGGKRKNKRGFFNLEEYNAKAQYVNLDKKTEPDFHCDAAQIPVKSNSYDVIILSEVIEHLENPVQVIKETYRILKPGGVILATVPFCYHVHADPTDYARYTQTYLQEKLSSVGFQNIYIEKQGLCFAVVTSILKFIEREKTLWWSKWLTNFFLRNFERWDQHQVVKSSPILSGYTTGYGIVATKPISTQG